MFPTRRGKQWYPTCGFKEIAVIYGAAQRSYRQTVQVFNRSRRQETGGTPLNTLCDVTQAEGLKVVDFLTRKTASVLKQTDFSPDGMPAPGCAATEKIPEAVYLQQTALQPALAAVCEEMTRKGLCAEDIEQVRLTCAVPQVDQDVQQPDQCAEDVESVLLARTANQVYEDAGQCVYLYLDDVGVKQQKPHREYHRPPGTAKTEPVEPDPPPPAATPDDAEKAQRPMVQNTVAHIEQGGKCFTLTARSVAEMLTFVLAFLLNNGLLRLNIKVCTDGQRSLQGAVLAFFSWHPRLTLLLDWFHLVKKFKEDLSLACQGRDIRNRHLKALLRLLWFGLVDQANTYLLAIPDADIKNRKAIDRLCGYLERNRQWIPCYALRRQLKLPNSSSPAERCNNLVTAKRQKHHGMSWSENGSYALTALNAVTVNQAARQWAEQRTIPFVLVAKAA